MRPMSSQEQDDTGNERVIRIDSVGTASSPGEQLVERMRGTATAGHGMSTNDLMALLRDDDRQVE